MSNPTHDSNTTIGPPIVSYGDGVVHLEWRKRLIISIEAAGWCIWNGEKWVPGCADIDPAQEAHEAAAEIGRALEQP